MGWWFGSQDSTKGAWDVDLKENAKYKSRKAGLKIIIRGIICLILFALLWFGMSLLTIYFNVERGNFIYYFIRFMRYILLIPLVATLQIPIGLYYFIRYFQVKS